MAANAHQPGTDVIRLVGLGGIGRHGVLPAERRDGQSFLVDLDIHLDTAAAAAGDDLAATVDYAAVARDVVGLIEGEPVHLLETLAARIADAVLAYDRVQAVDVTVHKPEAPLGLLFSDVQVRISRINPAGPAPAAAGTAATAAPAPPPPAPARAATPNEGVPVPSPVDDDANGNEILDQEPDGPAPVVLGLGGNVGDVRSTLRAVVEDLRTAPGLQVHQVSPLARTAAVVAAEAVAQPDYLNAVVLATTTLSPNRLLELTQSLEASYGRERTERWGQRTVDIDIIDYDGVSSTEEHLLLPHPRANERAFVLVPWAQVDADAFLPGLGGGPVAMLAETAPDRDGVRWLALDWLDRTGHSTDSGSFVVSQDARPAPVHRADPDAQQAAEAPPVVLPADDGGVAAPHQPAQARAEQEQDGVSDGAPAGPSDQGSLADRGGTAGQPGTVPPQDAAAGQDGDAGPRAGAVQQPAGQIGAEEVEAEPVHPAGPAQPAVAAVDRQSSEDPAEPDAAEATPAPQAPPEPEDPAGPGDPPGPEDPAGEPAQPPGPIEPEAPAHPESAEAVEPEAPASAQSPEEPAQVPASAQSPGGPDQVPAQSTQPPSSSFAPRWQPVQRRDEES